MSFVGLIRRSRHQAFLQQHRFSLYIKSHSEGVVSPLKSANRSVNDKVWTPWMADRGNPIAVILQINVATMSLKARFGRPDKAQPPSGKGAAEIMPDGA